MKRRFALVLASSLITGCASTKASGPRGELSDLLEERLGVADVVTPEQDEEARKRVRSRMDALLSAPLTRDAALELALLNNHALAADMESLGVAQAELVEAGLLENPTIGGDLVNSTTGNGLGGGFSIATSLLSAFVIPAQRKVAKANLKQAVLAMGHEAASLAEEVKRSFVEVQVTHADLRLHKEALQAAEVLDELAQRQIEAGNITEAERGEFGAALDEARMEFGHARMEAMMAREQLNVLMGLWGEDLDWKVATEIEAPPTELPDLQGLETRALEQRLDLSAARFDVEATTRAIKLRRAGATPAIEVGVVARNEVGNHSGHEWVIGPSLSLEIPIFDPGHADFAKLRAMLRAAEHRLAQLAIEVRSEVRIHRQHLVYAHQKAEYVREVLLPRREGIRDRMLERYNGMLIGPEELFDAELEVLHARRELNEALADYWVAMAELELAIGGRV